MQAGFERGDDPIDVAAVAAREDGDPAQRLIPYPIEKIGAGMLADKPATALSAAGVPVILCVREHLFALRLTD